MPALQQILASQWLIFTDLDGSLLDHHSYSAEAAKPALQRLADDGIAVVPASSKTLAELTALIDELQLDSPAIVENGACLHLPPHWSVPTADLPRFSPPYEDIIDILAPLKRHYRFKGFHDLGEAGIIETTGLSADKARLASQRGASEPIQWQDSEAALDAFIIALAEHHLKLIMGGRFMHVIGQQADKANAMEWLLNWLRQQGWQGHSMGLGDAPNDFGMLSHVDYPVLIRNPDTPSLPLLKNHNLYRTIATGPAGWNEAVNHIIYND